AARFIRSQVYCLNGDLAGDLYRARKTEGDSRNECPVPACWAGANLVPHAGGRLEREELYGIPRAKSLPDNFHHTIAPAIGDGRDRRPAIAGVGHRQRAVGSKHGGAQDRETKGYAPDVNWDHDRFSSFIVRLIE